jgi:hypothetical protein
MLTSMECPCIVAEKQRWWKLGLRNQNWHAPQQLLVGITFQTSPGFPSVFQTHVRQGSPPALYRASMGKVQGCKANRLCGSPHAPGLR